MKTFFTLILFFLLSVNFSHSQNKKTVEWLTWSLVQAVPSPVFIQDKNQFDNRLQFALRWQITPVNFSFNANKLVSPVQLFKVNPVRRFGGSAEIFLDPEWATASFKNMDLNRFSIGAGARIYFPLEEYGEYLALSVGAKQNFRKNLAGENQNSPSMEFGLYSFFGMLGFKSEYFFEGISRYKLSLSLKYY